MSVSTVIRSPRAAVEADAIATGEGVAGAAPVSPATRSSAAGYRHQAQQSSEASLALAAPGLL